MRTKRETHFAVVVCGKAAEIGKTRASLGDGLRDTIFASRVSLSDRSIRGEECEAVWPDQLRVRLRIETSVFTMSRLHLAHRRGARTTGSQSDRQAKDGRFHSPATEQRPCLTPEARHLL